MSKLGIGARIGDEGLYYQGSCLTYTVLTDQCGSWQSIKANTFNSAAVTYTSDAAAAGVKFLKVGSARSSRCCGA